MAGRREREIQALVENLYCNAAKYLHVWKVARQSGGDRRCLEAPWGIVAAGIGLDKQAFVAFREHLEKEKVGPFRSEILDDRVIRSETLAQS